MTAIRKHGNMGRKGYFWCRHQNGVGKIWIGTALGKRGFLFRFLYFKNYVAI